MSDRNASLDAACNITFKALKEKPPAKPVDLYLIENGKLKMENCGRADSLQIEKHCFPTVFCEMEVVVYL